MYPIANEVKTLFESEQKQILRITGGEKSPISKSVGPSAMASFSDAIASGALNLSVDITPVQTGSGDPSPTNVRPISGFDEVKVYDDQRYGGLVEWNQLATFDSRNIPSASKGITYSSADGKSVTFNGTATGHELRTGWFNLAENTGLSGKYGHIVLLLSKALSGEISDGTVRVGLGDSNPQNIGTPIRTTLPQSGQLRIKTYVSEGCICNDYTVTFNSCDLTEMFGPGNEPTTQLFLDYFPNIQDEYFPYNAGETMTVGQVNGEAYRAYAIEMPTEAGTVYGGTLDVTTGLLTVDRGNIASYAGETLPGAWISSMDVYTAGGIPTTGAQVVYELATPITYQLLPTQIALLAGVNNVWADCGDVTVEYATGYEYEINITDADVVIGSFSIDRFSCVGNKLEIGTATSAQMTVKLDNYDGRFNGIVFEGTELFVEIGIADWTQSNPTINWIPCGYFTPDEQPRSLNIITIHALDRMMQFDATMPTLTPWVTQSGDVMTDSQGNIIYFVSNVQFPVTVQNLVKRVALLCGVPFTQSLSNLPNYNYTLSALPTLQQEITFRNIIQWCAGIMGANAWIDWTGSLRFSWYGATTGYTSTTANRFSSDLHEDDITITGVQYTNTQNVTIVSGSADYAIDMTGNYLAATGIAEILPNVKNVINGFTYRPFTATVINAPYLWPMDIITFNKDGVNHTCAVTNVNFGINGATALESKGETAQTNSGTAPSGVTKEQGFLIEQAYEVATKLDESLDQEGIFNRLTNNGEVQGLILYNGKVYLNAEYIQTGTLAANLLMAGILTVGGANDGNGQIRILDENGNIIGLWNKNGIQISSGNINLNYNSTLSIAFDSNSTKKAVFNNSGFKLTLNSGATIATGSIIYTSSNYYPNVDMGSLMCGYTSESDGTWGTTMAPGYLSMSHDANYVVDRSFIYNQKSLSVFVYAGGTNRSFDVDLENNAMRFSGSFTLKENLTVLGAKSRVVTTDQYSDRLLYCYETPSPMFGDVGEGTIGEDGKCYIWLDPVFAQTITTTQYQVFLQRYGSGECWVSERKGSYFVVEGTPGMAFGWELKAKQRDFDQRRLERNDEPFTVPTQTYGEDAAKYIDELRKERIPA